MLEILSLILRLMKSSLRRVMSFSLNTLTFCASGRSGACAFFCPSYDDPYGRHDGRCGLLTLDDDSHVDSQIKVCGVAESPNHQQNGGGHEHSEITIGEIGFRANINYITLLHSIYPRWLKEMRKIASTKSIGARETFVKKFLVDA